jgi:hypothetical protein
MARTDAQDRAESQYTLEAILKGKAVRRATLERARAAVAIDLRSSIADLSR